MPVDPDETGTSPADMWMLMLIRMITRVAKPPPELEGSTQEDEAEMNEEEEGRSVKEWHKRQDQQRQTLCEYIMGDFPGR